MGFSQRGSLLTTTDHPVSFPEFGYRVALSSDGLALVVTEREYTSSSAPALFTYDWISSAWVQRGTAFAPEAVGGPTDRWALTFNSYENTPTSVNGNGTVIAVGDPGASSNVGGVYIYDRSGSAWIQRGSMLAPPSATASGYFGISTAISGDGLVLFVGALNWAASTSSYRGCVFVYDWSGSAWVQRGGALTPSDAANNDNFACSLATNDDGSVLIVNSQLSTSASSTNGKVYVYTWQSSAWVQRGATITTVSGFHGAFGASVATKNDGTTVYVGATLCSGPVANYQGAVIVYDWTGSVWNRRGKLTAPDAAYNVHFGAVATNGEDMLVVGCPYNNSNLGSVYTFDYAPDPTGFGTVAYRGSVSGLGGIPNSGTGAANYSAAVTGAGGFYVQFSTVSESAAATDPSSSAGSYYEAVRDGIEASVNASLQAAYNHALTETALGQVVVDAGKYFETLINEAVVGNIGTALAVGAHLVELGLAADSSLTLRQLAVDVAELILALDSMALGASYSVIESAAANDTAAARVTALALLIESIVAADTPAPRLSLITTVSEAALPLDTPAALAATITSVTETVDAGVLLRLGDDYYIGWVLNPEAVQTRNGYEPAVSQYQNYPFNSLAELKGRYYAAGSDGIYELTGSDDAGTAIVGYLKSGKLDFGTSAKKRLDSAYFAIATDGTVRLKTITHDGGENVERWYQLTSRDDGAVAENIRLKVGKGLASRYWQFELVIEDATTFEMDEMQLVPMTLTRRL